MSPRPQQRRPAGWPPSTVHEILKRSLYRGQIQWNRTRKRDRWGRTDATARRAAEWITIDAPELRIISDAAWSAARDRLAGIKAKVIAASGGKVGGRARDVESVHLLTGFARCACCGGSFCPLSRKSAHERTFVYGCSAYHKRGQAVCANGLVMRKGCIDEAVPQALGGNVLRPAIVDAIVDGVLAAMAPASRAPMLDRAPPHA